MYRRNTVKPWIEQFFFLSIFSQKTFFPFVCKDNFHTKISLEVMRLEKNIQNEMKVLFCLNIRFGLRNFFKKKLYCLISSFFFPKKAFFFLWTISFHCCFSHANFILTSRAWFSNGDLTFADRLIPATFSHLDFKVAWHSFE